MILPSLLYTTIQPSGVYTWLLVAVRECVGVSQCNYSSALTTKSSRTVRWFADSARWNVFRGVNGGEFSRHFSGDLSCMLSSLS